MALLAVALQPGGAPTRAFATGVPNFDSDGDGYTDDQEVALGMDPNAYCYAARADVDGDGTVSVLDMASVATHFLQTVPTAPARLDQDADGTISVLDLALIASRFLSSVTNCSQGVWSSTRVGSSLELFYGADGHFPEYGVLDTSSALLRLNTGPSSGWGTSIVLTASFWKGGIYYQGSSLLFSDASLDGPNLVLTYAGFVDTLISFGRVTLEPPVRQSIAASVVAGTSDDGTFTVDTRPGEAFKPVVLTSMHESATSWDTRTARINCNDVALPALFGWVQQPVLQSSRLALLGGTSTWKTKAPSVQLDFDGTLDTTGWANFSLNPNYDNVSVWFASPTVIQGAWDYAITVWADQDADADPCAVPPPSAKQRG